MSVVNRVLRDLDARKAAPEAVAGLGVHMTAPRPNHHEGFWRAVVVLMLVGLGCVAYLAYALRPRSQLATQLAYQYAGQIVRMPPTIIEPALPAGSDVPPVETAPKRSSEQRDPGPATLRLARSIETPYVEQSDRSSARANGKAGTVPAPSKSSPGALDAREQARLHQRLGNVLASLSRHEEAVGAYKAGLEGAPQNGGLWFALAVSLEALDRRPDAVDAYARALQTGSLERDESALAQQGIVRLR
jgi:tetratricopeptide (TPR) repeat protein